MAVALFAGRAAVAALAAWEYLGLTQHGNANPPASPYGGHARALCRKPAMAGIGIDGGHLRRALPRLAGLLHLPRTVEKVMADASASVFCMFYIGFTLLALPSLRAGGPSLVAFLLCVVWAGDTVAYYVGRAGAGTSSRAPSAQQDLGGRHRFRSRQPRGGRIAGGLATLLQQPSASPELSLLQTRWPSAILSFPDELAYWLLLAVVVNVAAQVGDLAESALKRSAGVKDSGSLLPDTAACSTA